MLSYEFFCCNGQMLSASRHFPECSHCGSQAFPAARFFGYNTRFQVIRRTSIIERNNWGPATQNLEKGQWYFRRNKQERQYYGVSPFEKGLELSGSQLLEENRNLTFAFKCIQFPVESAEI